MVSTRSAPTDQAVQAEAHESAEPVPAENAPSDIEAQADAEAATSRKRSAENGSPERAEKRRQLTPPGQNEDVTRNETEGQDDSKNGKESTVADQDARDKVRTSAQELLKLYACTKSFEYLSAILSRPNSRKGSQYRLQYEQFQRHRAKFNTTDNFIPLATLDSSIESQRFARCVNFVTFAASMLGSRDASFSQLDKHFLEVFVDKTGGRSGHLLKLQADIFLGLKTQAYIAQAAEKGTLQESLLNNLFPSDMSQRLQALQSDSTNAKLVNSEQTFVKQITMRKRHLMKKDSSEAIATLKDEYKWNDVLKNLIEYLKQHFEDVAQASPREITSINDDGENEEDVRSDVPVKPDASIAPPAGTTPVAGVSSHQDLIDGQTKQEPEAAQNEFSQMKSDVSMSTSGEANGLDNNDDILMKAMQAANKAMEGALADNPYMSAQPISNGSFSGQYIQEAATGATHLTHVPHNYSSPFPGTSQGPFTPGAPFASARLTQSPTAASVGQQPISSQPVHPGGPNGNTHPTHQLYEMAREATTGRPAQQQPAKKTGAQSQRKPWTKEEEKALLDGLDQVKGPHWSMILQLYGPDGKISKVLKNRDQVQLKDKARNLKLWFLKSGGEVPVNLRAVTGELKTRAPAAIRNAAAAAAAAAAQAQPNGASANHAASGNMSQPHHQGLFDPSNSPYAPATNYVAATAPANSVPPVIPPLPTAGPQDVSALANFDGWDDAADAAAAQVIKDLQVDLGIDTEIDPGVTPQMADVETDIEAVAMAAAEAASRPEELPPS